MLRVRMALSGWPGGPGLSTFYFTTPLEDGAAAIRCVGYVQEAVSSHWKNVWPLTVSSLISPEVDVIEAATGRITDTLSIPAVPAIAGAASSEYAPIATALLARLITGTFIAGRRLRGRIFFCPVGRNMVQADGTPDPTAIGFINAGGDSLRLGMDAGDLWVVWHRPEGDSGGSAGYILSVICPDKFSVLRSRRD